MKLNINLDEINKKLENNQGNIYTNKYVIYSALMHYNHNNHKV